MHQEDVLINLIEQYLAGTLSDEDASVLADRLEASDELQALFFQQFDVDFRLRQTVEYASEKVVEENPIADATVFMDEKRLDSLVRLACESPSLPVAVPKGLQETRDRQSTKRSVKREKPFRIRPLVLVLTLIVFFFSAVYWEFFGQKQGKVASTKTFSPLAKITGMAEVRWAPGTDHRKSGQGLEAERLRVEEGLLELTLSTGVRVVLDGPTDVNLNSKNQIHCGRGRLSVSVPSQAVGFEVTTPFMNVVDLGTEFSLSVGDEEARMHVIKGQVQLTRVSEGTKTLDEGSGFRISQAGVAETVNADRSTFISSQTVQRRVAASQHREMKRWSDTLSRFRDVSDLLINFDFSGDDTSIVNLSVDGRSRFGDGRLLHGRQTDGRFAGQHALAFRMPQDGVELNVPEILRNLTLVASVRLDEIGRQTQVLLASKSLGDGSIFWQIQPNGSLQLGIQRDERRAALCYTSSPCLKPKHSGGWYTIATVLDADGKSITHYLDGKRISKQPVDGDLPVRIGAATLGNGFWGQMKTTNLSLRGSMERFMLFQRALTENELHDLSCLSGE